MEEELTAAIAALSGAITWLFHLILKMSARQEKTSRDIGELMGRQKGIEELSSKVLETVEKTTLKAFRKNENDLS